MAVSSTKVKMKKKKIRHKTSTGRFMKKNLYIFTIMTFCVNFWHPKWLKHYYLVVWTMTKRMGYIHSMAVQKLIEHHAIICESQ